MNKKIKAKMTKLERYRELAQSWLKPTPDDRRGRIVYENALGEEKLAIAILDLLRRLEIAEKALSIYTYVPTVSGSTPCYPAQEALAKIRGDE